VSAPAALVLSPPSGVARARAALAAGSRSFALAGRLLPPRCRDDAAVVYAFCRWADDLVDHAPPGGAAAAVVRLQAEVAAVFSGASQSDPVLAAFQEVALRRAIAREHVDGLIAGFAMDAHPLPIVYRTWEELLLYCFRVAGTVGLMMCQVMGSRDPRAARHAAALGMGMQLTNIARDVAEDWASGRLYVPREALGPGGGTLVPGGPLDPGAAALLTRAVPALLAAAAPFYRWGDAGLPALDGRAAVSVRAARLIYSAIGDRLAARGCDVAGPRVVVSRARKLALFARACLDVARSHLLSFGSPRLPPVATLPALPGPLPVPFLRLPEP
jgi:15-cis-phytoene synthase